MIVLHAGHYQQSVEYVNTALLSAFQNRQGDTLTMPKAKRKSTSGPHAKPPNRARLAFGNRLRVAREAAGYDTATAFANALGLSLQTYSRWERGETEPGLTTLQKIRAKTGASMDFLICGELPAVERRPTPPHEPDQAA